MELIFDERASKGIVKDYFSGVSNNRKDYREPPFIYQTLLEMAENDSVLFTAISLTVDLATQNGYTFLGDNKRDIKKAIKLFDDTLDFDQVIENVMWQMLIYGDAYLEIRWNESKTVVEELHPLDTSEMVIDYDKHGETKRYIQKVSGKGKEEWVIFSPDEVIHFRQYWVGSQVYSRSPFKSIARSYATKVYGNDYLSSIFRNLPPKLVYFLKNANENQRKLFVENLVRAKTNPNIDLIAQGEAFDSKINQVTFDTGLMSVLEYLRKEVLMVTRVPPHWVGILDGANRGIGENVVIPYETKIKKLQGRIASHLSRELMPKLKLSNLQFKWNSISLMDDKTITDVMSKLKSLNYDEDTITGYGREKGLQLIPDAKMEEPEEPEEGMPGQAPSREGADKKNGKMTNNLDKKGVSAEGKAKLEKRQGDSS